MGAHVLNSGDPLAETAWKHDARRFDEARLASATDHAVRGATAVTGTATVAMNGYRREGPLPKDRRPVPCRLSSPVIGSGCVAASMVPAPGSRALRALASPGRACSQSLLAHRGARTAGRETGRQEFSPSCRKAIRWDTQTADRTPSPSVSGAPPAACRTAAGRAPRGRSAGRAGDPAVLVTPRHNSPIGEYHAPSRQRGLVMARAVRAWAPAIRTVMSLDSLPRRGPAHPSGSVGAGGGVRVPTGHCPQRAVARGHVQRPRNPVQEASPSIETVSSADARGGRPARPWSPTPCASCPQAFGPGRPRSCARRAEPIRSGRSRDAAGDDRRATQVENAWPGVAGAVRASVATAPARTTEDASVGRS